MNKTYQSNISFLLNQGPPTVHCGEYFCGWPLSPQRFTDLVIKRYKVSFGKITSQNVEHSNIRSFGFRRGECLD